MVFIQIIILPYSLNTNTVLNYMPVYGLFVWGK